MTKHETNGVVLNVINKNSFSVGRILARVGLKTYMGIITRLTPKGIEVENRDGIRRVIRAYDRLPAVYWSNAPKSEILNSSEVE